MTDEAFYFLDDVVKLLGCSRGTFELWRRDGKLWWLHELQPRLGRPRYLRKDLDDYLSGKIEVRPRAFFKGRRRS